MKKIFVFVVLAVAVVIARGQVSGKYAADKFVSHADSVTMKSTTYYPIEVGGDNYAWSITAQWKSTSKLTHSYLQLQVSPDSSFWMNYVAGDSMKNNTYAFHTGTDAPFRWVRLKVSVTSGDSINGLKAWYEFKRK